MVVGDGACGEGAGRRLIKHSLLPLSAHSVCVEHTITHVNIIYNVAAYRCQNLTHAHRFIIIAEAAIMSSLQTHRDNELTAFHLMANK